MKLKKFLSMTLATLFFTIQFNWITLISKPVVYAVDPGEATTTVATKYFYNQLTDDAKVFYDLIEDMYEEGDLQKGNVTKEVTGIENQAAKLDEYAAGSQDLLNTMGAARDAFVCDYPNVFYVDFDYLTMRVTQSKGVKHLYLGTGRSDNYINKEFLTEENQIDTEKVETAINTVDTKINEIVQKAKDKENNLQAGQDLIEQQVKVVHDEIIKATKYTYEFETDHPYTIRTTYGVFGLDEGNAVCEGFSRALKVCLDRLNIPCVLVRGIYRVTENQPEEHMWAYVQLSDEKWYAVDPTFDNKDIEESGEEVVGAEFFLVGADKMYKHVPTGILSAANYEFSYPQIENVSDKFDVIFNQGPLKVELDDESYDMQGGTSSAILRVSYNGHGCQKAIEEDGVYILTNFYQEGRDGVTRSSGWAYPRPDIYGDSGMHDTENYIEFMIIHVSYLQVAVTDIAPAPFQDSRDPEVIKKQTTYMGTETSLIYKTDILHNPNGSYVAPPYVKRANPAVSSVQYIGKTYPVTIEYDDVLIKDDSGEDPTVNVMIYEPLTDTYRDATDPIQIGEESHPRLQYKITDFNFDGQSTFTFNFTPSEMWADDTVYYIFEFKGLMGSRSHKEPLSTVYSCAHECSAYAYTAQGFNLNVYGKPVLMDDNIDMSQMEIESADKEKMQELSELLKHRLTLVTTKTTKAETSTMEDKLEDYLNEEDNRDVYSSETYNINLTLCKRQQKELKSGVGVRVMLGFPQGYGPDDEGVTFKAYHYKKNEQGEITGVEEIPCTITKLGLLIEVYSFSPFTIAAVQETEADKQNTNKVVVLNTTEGGKVTDTSTEKVADTINKLETGASKQFKITADEDYEIDEIMVGDTVINDFKGNLHEYTLDVKYDSLEEESTMIKIAFAAKSVHEQDAEQEATVVTQPVINSPVLTLTAAAYHDVKDSDEDDDVVKAEVQNLLPGDKFEVTFSIAEIANVGNGINAIGGILDYDSNLLEIDEQFMTGSSKTWKYNYYDDTKKFLSETVNDKTLVTTSGEEILTLKFKVKEDINMDDEPTKATTISLKNIEAGTGKLGDNAILRAIDVEKTVTIAKPLEEKLTLKDNAQSQHVSMKEDSQVIVLPLNTTFEKLNELLNYSQTPKYHSTMESTVRAHTSVVVDDENKLISTGDTVTVGTKIWTFAVRGDSDGDGAITVNDVAVAKLHFIGKEPMAGAYLEALETDDSEGITVNDISRIKLVFIQKIKDLFSDF